MEKKCINCLYFKQGSLGPTTKEYIWGDCQKKERRSWADNNTGSIINFTWADGYCDYFTLPEDNKQYEAS